MGFENSCSGPMMCKQCSGSTSRQYSDRTVLCWPSFATSRQYSVVGQGFSARRRCRSQIITSQHNQRNTCWTILRNACYIIIQYMSHYQRNAYGNFWEIHLVWQGFPARRRCRSQIITGQHNQENTGYVIREIHMALYEIYILLCRFSLPGGGVEARL